MGRPKKIVSEEEKKPAKRGRKKNVEIQENTENVVTEELPNIASPRTAFVGKIPEAPETSDNPEDADSRIAAVERAMTHFMAQLNYKNREAEGKLQSETAAKKIADIQGVCAGYRSILAFLKDAGLCYDAGKSFEIPYLDRAVFTFSEKSKIVPDIKTLKESKGYETYVEKVEGALKSKKDYLFFESTQSRDVFYFRGWFSIINFLRDWSDGIISSYNRDVSLRETEKNKSLPFDDDDLFGEEKEENLKDPETEKEVLDGNIDDFEKDIDPLSDPEDTQDALLDETDKKDEDTCDPCFDDDLYGDDDTAADDAQNIPGDIF
jgi:hypothetical protein